MELRKVCVSFTLQPQERKDEGGIKSGDKVCQGCLTLACTFYDKGRGIKNGIAGVRSTTKASALVQKESNELVEAIHDKKFLNH